MPHPSRLLLRCARHPTAGALVALLLGRLGPWLPLGEVRATRELLLFRHPVPSGDHHFLIVPRRRCPTLLDLDPARLAEAIALGRAQAAALGDAGFDEHVLTINGGAFQDVKQAHFHLTRGTLRPRAAGELDVAGRDPDGAAAVLATVRAHLAARGGRVRAYRLLFGRPPRDDPDASWFRLVVDER